MIGSLDVAGNQFIANGTGVYAGESTNFGRAWINSNSFKENGWGIFAVTEYNIYQCRGNAFQNNRQDMNSVAAAICR